MCEGKAVGETKKTRVAASSAAVIQPLNASSVTTPLEITEKSGVLTRQDMSIKHMRNSMKTEHREMADPSGKLPSRSSESSRKAVLIACSRAMRKHRRNAGPGQGQMSHRCKSMRGAAERRLYVARHERQRSAGKGVARSRRSDQDRSPERAERVEGALFARRSRCRSREFSPSLCQNSNAENRISKSRRPANLAHA